MKITERHGRTFTVNVVWPAVTVAMVVLPLLSGLWGASDAALGAYERLMTGPYTWIVGGAVIGANAAKTAQRAKAGNPPEPTG